LISYPFFGGLSRNEHSNKINISTINLKKILTNFFITLFFFDVNYMPNTFLHPACISGNAFGMYYDNEILLFPDRLQTQDSQLLSRKNPDDPSYESFHPIQCCESFLSWLHINLEPFP